MSVLLTDLLVKTAIEAGIADLRMNTWILDDIISGLETDVLSKAEYGAKETARFKEWFLNTDIPVLLQYRVDNPVHPCIAVIPTGSQELLERKNLADDMLEEEFDVKNVKSTPQRIYDPFTPKEYNPAKGEVTFPDGITTSLIVPGQFLVSQSSGKAYQILKCESDVSFMIKANTVEDFKDAYIVPAVALWNLQRELTFFQESFSILCYAQSDPVQCTWLHALVTYILLRYKEAYFEGRGFEVSSISSGPLTKDAKYDPEFVFFKSISLIGHVECSWIKFIAPKLADVRGGIRIMDGPRTPDAYQAQVQKQAWKMEDDPEE